MFQISGFHKSSEILSFWGERQELMGRPFIKLFSDPYHIIKAPASASTDPFEFEGGLVDTYDFTTGFGFALKGGYSLT